MEDEDGEDTLDEDGLETDDSLDKLIELDELLTLLDDILDMDELLKLLDDILELDRLLSELDSEELDILLDELYSYPSTNSATPSLMAEKNRAENEAPSILCVLVLYGKSDIFNPC